MKIIKPQVENITPKEYSIEAIHKQIEIAGRTCYQSHDKITKESANIFFGNMLKNKHYAMLEHGTVYLKVSLDELSKIVSNSKEYSVFERIISNKYSKNMFALGYFYITTNMRVIVENPCYDLSWICEPTEYHQKRYSFRIICDRAIANELVRHRVFSFAQESTRYCNYSKDKFNKELTFIKPYWYEETENGKSNFINSINTAEKEYFSMLKNGLSPQQARAVLPLSLKTELIMTGFLDDWEYFFSLRCAENAHPDARIIANKIKQSIYESIH